MREKVIIIDSRQELHGMGWSGTILQDPCVEGLRFCMAGFENSCRMVRPNKQGIHEVTLGLEWRHHRGR